MDPKNLLRLTSTPRHGHTSTLLKRLSVSPILPSSDVVRRPTSMSPVLNTNLIRPSNVSRCSGPETKVPSSTSGTGSQEVCEKVSSQDLKKQLESMPAEKVTNQKSVEQLSENNILKSAKKKQCKSQSDWQIPKETKKRISHKRKSCVPSTVSKRTKKTATNFQQSSEESLFESPELPNFIEVLSLSKGDEANVFVNKPDVKDNQEGHEGNVSDGITPLQKLHQEGSKTIKLKDKIVPVNKPKERWEGKENIEQGSCLYPADQINNKNKKNTKKSEINLDGNVNVESANIKTDPLTNGIANDVKRSQPKRGRKPIVAKAEIISDVPKKIASKKKVESVKLNSEHQENPSKLTVESKPQRKNVAVKGNKKQNPKPFDITDHLDEVSDVDIKIFSSESKEETKSAPKETNKNGKSTDKSIKKVTKNIKTTKKAVRENVPTEEKDKQSLYINLCTEENRTKNEYHPDVIPQSNTSKTDVAVESAKNTSSESQFKKQAAVEIEASTKSQNTSTLIGQDNLKSTSQEAIFSKPSNKNKSGSAVSLVTKNRCLNIRKNSTIKQSADGNLSPKLTELDSNENIQSVNGKECFEKKDRPRRQIISGRYSSKGQSKQKPMNNVCAESKIENTQENLNTLDDKSDRIAESIVPSSRKRRKPEHTDCEPSDSELRFYFREKKQPPVAFWKNRTTNHMLNNENSPEHTSKKSRSESSNSGKSYNIRDLFGSNEPKSQELQPGVTSYTSIHLHNFMKTGRVQVEAGAALSKISTNTTYHVLDGTALVRISRHSKTFVAEENQSCFFVPKGIDASITNVGNVTLKMVFTKFRG